MLHCLWFDIVSLWIIVCIMSFINLRWVIVNVRASVMASVRVNLDCLNSFVIVFVILMIFILIVTDYYDVEVYSV
jgi:hypothetical protein